MGCPVWIVGNWSKCKITLRKCPNGMRTRFVTCTSENELDCDQSKKPVVRGHCKAECPSWKTGPWSKCKGSCKKAEMTRRVWCHGEDRRCDMRTKPIGRKRCQLSKCKEWETGDWYRCPVSCGGGIRSRRVICRDLETGGFARGCNRESKPSNFQACALVECPSSLVDRKPPINRRCKQSYGDAHFCNLLRKPSLSELCLFKTWRERCCENCPKIHAQILK
ncbi:A disintegrin and metalloproteinase with thrombospondin motifs 7-like [Xenia sp. Carnegie-2017]|uniref:A disintegrin and metalloproteinase with thrombospondin motifs 7-like n=1 Tax=Xenia sp. Carnegie-2017 TaxID=2897299 RepID=UPI001F04A12C|nr:A disintegrin and metalloproteinase with thrombospondin motifs 7-like [Xenia sp. Carnegie-2017]